MTTGRGRVGTIGKWSKPELLELALGKWRLIQPGLHNPQYHFGYRLMRDKYTTLDQLRNVAR